MSDGKSIPGQARKGQMAARIALRCLDGAPLELRNDEEVLAWGEMHSVAHLWAALISLSPESGTDPLALMNAMLSGNYRMLLLSERILDRMQERDDLKHADPWRCSPEMRAVLEAEHGVDA